MSIKLPVHLFFSPFFFFVCGAIAPPQHFNDLLSFSLFSTTALYFFSSFFRCTCTRFCGAGSTPFFCLFFFLLSTWGIMSGSWFEFGYYYDTITPGRRKRFFSQRDDPCDSEEEKDYDDEANDRPVYYYPLRESEKGSSNGSEEGYQFSDSDTEDDSDAFQRWLRRRWNVEGAMRMCPATAQYGVSADIPSLYGATTVSLPQDPSINVWYGGLPSSSPALSVPGHHTFVTRTVIKAAPSLTTATATVPLLERVMYDESLGQKLEWSALHPTLVEGLANDVTVQHTRFGHCCCSLSLSNINEALSQRCDVRFDREMVPLVPPCISAHACLVVGGAEVPCQRRSMPMTSLRTTEDLKTLYSPLICLTLLSKREPPTFWCKDFPLLVSGSFCPSQCLTRVHATLTPWPVQPARHHLEFAYLGGSLNGRNPAAFALTKLDVETTQWMCTMTSVKTVGIEPSPRYGHTTTVVDSSLLVFGGLGHNGHCLHDLFELNTEALIWREIATPISLAIPPRAFHCAILVPPPSTSRIFPTPAGSMTEDNWLRTVGLVGRSRSIADTGKKVHRLPTPNTIEQVRSSEPRDTSEWAPQRVFFVGGISDGGGNESLLVSFTPSTGRWEAWYVPLMDLLFETDEEGDRTSLLSPVVRTLCHEAQQRAITGGASSSSSPCCFFLGSCHGSQAQVIPCGEGFLVCGGDNSPPAMLCTLIVPWKGRKLRERCLSWMLCGLQEKWSSSHRRRRLSATRCLNSPNLLLRTMREEEEEERVVEEGDDVWLSEHEREEQGHTRDLRNLAERTAVEEQFARWRCNLQKVNSPRPSHSQV